MGYASSVLYDHRTEEAFRIYITDSLYYQAQNKCLGKRFSDLIHPSKQDDKSGNEIAADLINRLGLKVGDSNG